ncbi:MAG: SPOR domain-containing protein [Candidatus Omnitrophica bacterium]|nr:SPOR domain-containing protein [Candidatus Omnitrophota bacterium]
MNIHFGNQSQFELFPGTTGDPIENTAPRFIFSRVVLTFENVVVIFVFVIVGMIIAFSLGVERGRVKARLARPAAIQSTSPVSMPSVMPNPQISIAPANNTLNGSVPALSGTAIVATQSSVAMAARPGVRPAPVSTVSAVSRPLPVALSASEKVVDKGYTIQVASYKSDSMAQKESANLKRQGLESFVVTKGNYLIVCVGRFSGSQSGKDEAKSMFNKLKKRYKDSIVRSF